MSLNARQQLDSMFRQGHNSLTSKANELLNSKKKNKVEKQADIKLGEEWNAFAKSYKSQTSFLGGNAIMSALDEGQTREYQLNVVKLYNFFQSKHFSEVYGSFCQNMMDKLIGMFGIAKNESAYEKKQTPAVDTSKQAQKPVFNPPVRNSHRNKYANMAKKTPKQSVYVTETPKVETPKVEIPKFNLDIDGQEVPSETKDPAGEDKIPEDLKQSEETQAGGKLAEETSHKILPRTDVKEEEDPQMEGETVEESGPALGNGKDEPVKVPSVAKPVGKRKKVIIVEIVSCSDCERDEDIRNFMGIEN